MSSLFSELELVATYPFELSMEYLLIDVGAHHGGFSKCFAKKGWKVIAFEPEQKNYISFARNMESFNNVTCIPKAVSDKSGEIVPFYVSEEHYGIHSIKPFHVTHKAAYDVETVRLDQVLEEQHIQEVTLLKIDTEGADYLALKGFDFEKFMPQLIMVEFMDDRSLANFAYTHHDVARFMSARGYGAFISEWAPIKEYGRDGVKTEPHTWLQCVPYPLDHEPAWGNLIFVPERDKDKFSKTLEKYLALLQVPAESVLRKYLKRIPGAIAVHKFLTRN